MPEFKTIDDIANAYVKANRVKNETVKKQIKQNFLSGMKNNYSDVKAAQVVFVDFDRITIDLNNELVDIEI